MLRLLHGVAMLCARARPLRRLCTLCTPIIYCYVLLCAPSALPPHYTPCSSLLPAVCPSAVPASHYTPRSSFGDFSELSRTYAGHALGNNVLCAEVHIAAQKHVVARPSPPLPPSLCPPFDVFSLPARSPTNDVVVLLALLSKLAMEPLSFSNADAASSSSGANGAGGSSSSGGNNTSSGAGGSGAASSSSTSGYRRVTGLLLRDTALHLLNDAFDAAGRGFASSPLLIAAVTRIVCPSLWSNVLSPRIRLAHVSICMNPDPRLGEVAEDALSVAREREGSTGSNSGGGGEGEGPPTSVLKAVLAVISAMWAARGSDESATSGGGGGGGGGGVRNLSGSGFLGESPTSPMYPPSRSQQQQQPGPLQLQSSDSSGAGATSSAPDLSSSSSVALSGSAGTFLPVVPYASAGALNIREACAREIGALLRSIVMHVLSSRSAPPTLRLDAVDGLMAMVAAPQVRVRVCVVCVCCGCVRVYVQ